MIHVFGHLSPDTDATGSAIIWAWYVSNHTGAEATPYILGELNSETNFVLSHFEVPTPAVLESLPEGATVALVDTNNPQELPEGIEKANVIQIIDHHKLVGGLASETPIDITMRPVACTATVLFDLMGITPDALPREIAGVMLSCILSDTLAFRSPTTTPHDKDVAEQLAAALSISIEDFANELFAAKSDLSAFTDQGLITLDSKKYTVGDTNLRVSVIETTNPASVLERKAGIVAAINDTIEKETDVDEVLFFIVDILEEAATVLTYNDTTAQIISNSFDVQVESDTETLPGIVSRKKQILPALTL